MTNHSSANWRSRLHTYGRYPLIIVVLAAFCVWTPTHVHAQNSNRQVFETDLTKDIFRSSGEPQIVVNPKNPKQLAVIEQIFGSKAVPAYSLYDQGPEFWRHFSAGVKDPLKDPQWDQTGLPVISNDGGKTWIRSRLPQPLYFEKNGLRYLGSCDPMVAAGPDGALYASTEVIVMQPGKETPVAGAEEKEDGSDVYDLAGGSHVLVYSADWGKTWSAPYPSDQPIDRPWMKVDQTTGKVYVASSGPYEAGTGRHNVKDVGILDRWLVTWEPHLRGKGEPHRMGGPEQNLVGSPNNDLAASHGTVASIFTVGGTGRNQRGASPSAQSMPDSVKSIVPSGTECVPGKQPVCLIFQTSTDDGANWTRHFVPTPEGFTGGTNLSADPQREGRYAISMTVLGKLMSVVTDDSGKTWSTPASPPETTTGSAFKTRIAYSPNGVLTLIWKQERTDLNAPPSSPPPHFRGFESAFDVFVAISCDGGLSWRNAIRVNTKPSPQGEASADDLTYIDADTQYAHFVWGDRRITDDVRKMAGNVPGPTFHSYYGRVAFATASNGTRCGR